jgi:ABC-type spermidine/putrescine transport system permease subunit I
MDISIQIWLCIGFLAYFATLQLWSDFMDTRMQTVTKNKTIEELRTKYKVTIKTFYCDKRRYGFVMFRSLWINQVVFKAQETLLFTFHHEYYHLKHHHKSWKLFMRFLISLTPLTNYFVNWGIFIVILLASAYLIKKITDIFEKKTNEYAYKMIPNVTSKGKA